MNSGLFRLVIVFLCCGYVTSALGLCPAVAFVFVFGLVVCASPHFERVALAGGLFRTVSHSPFVKLGNSALATYPNNLSGKSSWVIGRASSTLLPQCAYQQSAIPYVAFGRIQL